MKKCIYEAWVHAILMWAPIFSSGYYNIVCSKHNAHSVGA